MTNFVEAVQDYVELEGRRFADTDEELLRKFAHGNRKDMEGELLAVYPEPDPSDPKSAARIKASVQRQLQKWGLTGKTGKKVVRGPLAVAGGKLAKVTRTRLRTVLLRRRNARVKMTVAGAKRFTPSPGPWQKGTATADAYERDMLDILKLNEKSLASSSGVEPPSGSGEKGELACVNVFTGYWFGTDAEPLECDGKVVVKQPYHNVMEYDAGCVFDVERSSEGRKIA